MAHVPGFDHDIFISFSHVDNTDSGGIRWVSQFHKDLEGQVKYCLGGGKELKIWRDEQRLEASSDIGRTIDKALSGTAVLVCVVSSSFINSEWCPQELDEFCLRADSPESPFALTVDNKWRIFKVLRRTAGPLRHNKIDEKNLRSIAFFDEKSPDNPNADYWPTTRNDPRERGYWNALDSVADSIAKLLSTMRDEQLARNQVKPLGPISTETTSPPVPVSVQPQESDAIATVYLADVADGFLNERSKLQEALWQKKIRVLPEALLPLQSSRAKDAVREALRQSQLSVHMLGAVYGRPLEGAPDSSLPRLQYELAREIAEEGKLARIIWLPPDLPADGIEELQSKLLDEIRQEPSSTAHFDLQEGQISLNDLKQTILKRVTKARRPPPDANKCTIYLSCTEEDLKHVATAEMIDWLDDQHKVWEDTREGLNPKKLNWCDGLIIVYGNKENKDRAEEHAMEASELTAGRTRKPLPIAVFDGPPNEKPRFGLHSQEILILNNRDGFDEASIDPFLQKLKDNS